MKSWKTSLAGVIAGLPPILLQLSNILSGQPVDWSLLWTGIGAIVLGFFAKDHDKTGV